jgi:UDP-galactose transporter
MIGAKSASLLAGILQQAALVLIIRFSKTQHSSSSSSDGVPGGDTIGYLTSVAVAASEIFKLCLSYVLEVKSQPSNPAATSSGGGVVSTRPSRSWKGGGSWISTLVRMLRVSNKESAKLIIPAALYVVQNNLLFVALSNLSVPMYQVTNQGKLLTTALISRIMLNKKLTGLQYFAITLLGLGVAVIHLSEYYANVNATNSDSSEATASSTGSEDLQHQNQVLGLCAVLVSCFTSGFSGVYFELILKTSNTKQSLHVKNFQLAFWSFLLATMHISYRDSRTIQEHGLFQGFDWIVILVIVAQGMTGFVVSLMLKYADAVLKGFAVAVAAMVSTIASVVIFGTHVDASFMVGASMVALAIKLYSYKHDRVKLPTTTSGTTTKDRRWLGICCCCNRRPQMVTTSEIRGGSYPADSLVNEESSSANAPILETTINKQPSSAK